MNVANGPKLGKHIAFSAMQPLILCLEPGRKKLKEKRKFEKKDCLERPVLKSIYARFKNQKNLIIK